jgi:hypothetical protein
MGWAGLRIELGQAIFSSYDDGGILRVQHDGLGESPLVGSSETLHPLGFASRAPAASTGPDGKPLDGGGCKVFVVFDGTEYRILYLGDHRDTARQPPLPAEGGAVMYAPGSLAPSFHVINSKNGTHQIYVEVGNSAHVITIGVDGNGEPTLELTHARGMALTFFDDRAVLKNRTGNVYAELNDDGGILNGNWKVTGAFDVGATSFPLTKFAELAAWVTAAQAALAAIAGVPINSSAASAPVGTAAGLAAAFLGGGMTTMTKGF